MSDSEYADVLLRGNRGEELSDRERYQYERHRTAWFSYFENIVYQHGIGLYDDADFSVQINRIRGDIDSTPGFKRSWCASRARRTRALVEAIEGDDLDRYC